MRRNYFSHGILTFMFSAIVLLSSCSKKNDNPATTPTGLSKPTVTTSASALRKSEAPKSKKVVGTKTVAGKTVGSAVSTSGKMSATNQAKFNQLVNGSALKPARTAGAASAWYIESVNGTLNTSMDYVYLFDNDGAYYIYDISANNWDWGWYYIDEEFTTIAFDIDLANPEVWTINSISDTEANVSRAGMTIVLKSIELSNYEEATYTVDELKAQIQDTVWFLAYELENGVSTIEKTSSKLHAITFDGSGGFADVTATVYTDGDTRTDSTATGTWTINSSGELVLTYASGEVIALSIDYVDKDYLFLSAYIRASTKPTGPTGPAERATRTTEGQGTLYEWGLVRQGIAVGILSDIITPAEKPARIGGALPLPEN
jgi:hypothetical protein